MEMLQMMLHSKKLNYDRLNKIIPQYIPQKANYDTVNIIVDLYDVIKQLYKPQLLEQINYMKAEDRWQITSEIINIVGHYRHYFASRLYKYTNIYFIYTNGKSNYHTSIYKEYRNDFYKKRLDSNDPTFGILTKILKENMLLIKTFLEYIPHVYFINSKNIEYSLIPYMLLKEDIIDNSIPTLLISNEEIYYQDFAHNENLLQLLIKGDKSRIVTKENVWEEIIKDIKNKPEIRLIPDMIPVLFSCTGYKNYDIPKVNRMGNARAIPFIYKELLDKGYIHNIDYTSVESFSEAIMKSEIKDEFKSDIIRNFKLLSHSGISNVAYNDKDIERIKLQTEIDKIDSVSVKYINEKYFENYPILLDMCFEGEEYN